MHYMDKPTPTQSVGSRLDAKRGRRWMRFDKLGTLCAVTWVAPAIRIAIPNLKIPLISDEALNIGKISLFEEVLTELFHERPQAILPHRRDELIMQAALAEQRMDTSLGCAGL